MDKEFLKQVSVRADVECLVSSKKSAEELIKIHNPNCDIVLASVSAYHGDDVLELSSVNDFSFVWYDRNSKENEVNFLPVFFSNCDDIPAISDIFEIEEDDVFCFDGMVYYADFSDDNTEIRRINMLFSQEIVEKIYADTEPDAVIEDIFLVNIKDVTREGLKYLVTCWYIVREDGYIDYMPVFLEDVCLLSQYNIPSLICEEVKPNQGFKSHNKIFSLQKDVQGKLFIQNSIEFMTRINKADFREISKRKTKIIPLKRKNGD